MELDKQTIKKIIGLISFAILLSWGLKNTEFIKSLILHWDCYSPS